MSGDYSLENSKLWCQSFFLNLGGAKNWVILVVTEILKVDLYLDLNGSVTARTTVVSRTISVLTEDGVTLCGTTVTFHLFFKYESS